MSKRIFSSQEIEELKKNKYVKKVSSKSITYSNEFKKIFIIESNSILIPRVIFEKYGFNTNLMGVKRIQTAANRWKEKYKKYGFIGLSDCMLKIIF